MIWFTGATLVWLVWRARASSFGPDKAVVYAFVDFLEYHGNHRVEMSTTSPQFNPPVAVIQGGALMRVTGVAVPAYWRRFGVALRGPLHLRVNQQQFNLAHRRLTLCAEPVTMYHRHHGGKRLLTDGGLCVNMELLSTNKIASTFKDAVRKWMKHEQDATADDGDLSLELAAAFRHRKRRPVRRAASLRRRKAHRYEGGPMVSYRDVYGRSVQVAFHSCRGEDRRRATAGKAVGRSDASSCQ